jgi:hypothetical protein
MQCALCKAECETDKRLEWVSGRRLVTQDYHTTTVVFTDYRPLPVAVCEECFWPAAERRLKRDTTFLVVFTAVASAVLMISFFSPSTTNAGRVAISLVLSLLWLLLAWSRGRLRARLRQHRVSPGLMLRLLRPIAESVTRTRGHNDLLTIEEYQMHKEILAKYGRREGQ